MSSIFPSLAVEIWKGCDVTIGLNKSTFEENRNYASGREHRGLFGLVHAEHLKIMESTRGKKPCITTVQNLRRLALSPPWHNPFKISRTCKSSEECCSNVFPSEWSRKYYALDITSQNVTAAHHAKSTLGQYKGTAAPVHFSICSGCHSLPTKYRPHPLNRSKSQLLVWIEGRRSCKLSYRCASASSVVDKLHLLPRPRLRIPTAVLRQEPCNIDRL